MERVTQFQMNSNVIRDRFQKSRPNSMCDKSDMVPVDGNSGSAVAAGAANADNSAATANGAEGESGGGKG